MEKKKRGRNGQCVMCCNDGRTFSSLHDAAKNYAISVSAITRQLKHERKTAAGLYFIEISGTESIESLNELRLHVIQQNYRLKGVFIKNE